MSDPKSALIIELAEELMEMVRKIAPAWQKAYFRYYSDEIKFGSNGSYVVDSQVLLIDPFAQNPFFRSMNEKSGQLLGMLDKKSAVLLLEADSESNYDIKFEYENFNRWKITKIGGATGVPEGV